MGKLRRTPVIAIIGASSATPEVMEVAADVGRAVAKEGWHMVCGGGAGVMEAACEGFVNARDEFGPGRNIVFGITPTDREDWANPHVDIVIPTGMGWARNAVITRTAWAVIAVGGCAGTLSELAFAWQMDKPIVAMSTTGGWAARLSGQSIDDRRPDVVMEATDAAQAIALIKPHVEDKEK